MHTLSWFLGTVMALALPVISPQALETEYRYSQYCLQGFRDQHAIDPLLPEYAEVCENNSEFRGNIDDPGLYTFAGITYLKGESPAAINWETQPLTKYIFGLSISLFRTPLVAQYLFGLGSLVVLYLLGRRVLPSYLSVLSPLLLLLDPLFRDQLTSAYLDLSVTFWVLLYLLYLGKNKPWWLGGIILGLLALSKSFSLGILAAVVGMFYMRDILSYLKTLLVSLLIYLLGYTMFFVRGHGLLDFAELHLSILRLYRSYVPEYPKGEIFRIIMTGQWRTWWGDKGVVTSPFWSPLWAFSLLASIYAGLSKRLRANTGLFIHLIWVCFALIFISLRLVFPRYLLPVLPSMYLLLVYALYSLVASVSQFASIVSNGSKNRSIKKGQ